MVVACACALAGAAMADLYDTFGDGQYCQNPNEPNLYDPNLWDRDNPHWTTAAIEATSSFFSAQGGSLEMRSDGINLFASSVGAYVDSGDRDADTSDTWFDSSESFYLLSRVAWPPNPNNPNDPNMLGAAILGVCVEPNT
jgi:hypothetical protein